VDGVRAALLLMGVAALSFCAYIYADAKIYDAYESWSLDREARGLNRNVMAFLGDVTPLRYVLPESDKPDANAAPSQSAANSRPEQTEHRKSVAPRELIGRIIIPRLGVRGIVKEGVDDRTLRRAVGHVPGTALPGESGNVGLAAHRDTFFRGLKDVRKNDRIRIETPDGDYEYQVDSIRIVKPNDVEVLASSNNHPALTLVTCYPFYYVGNAPKRFIVRATQVDVKPRELQGS
jgi:sortase A